MTGILYLCATPIGNLGDMTPRVVETLRSVDLIAAEDTRNSLKLMTHFEIHTPMTSYHEYNKVEKAYTLIAKLQEGQNIALITDAGTPAISDPGEVLVRMCLEAGIRVTSLPGAAACITALTMSGLSTRRFCFEGFLPPDKKERTEILEDCREESRTMIFYEAPHHLKKTLQELAAVLAGPLANLLWGLLLAWLGGPWLVPAGANLVLCAFNLLPVRPLDGGRALELLVSWAAGPAAGERAARWSGIAAALLSTAALWAVMDRSGGSLWLLPAAGGMLAAAMREFWGGALKKHYF